MQWEDFQLEIVSSCWGNVLCNLGMFLDMASKKGRMELPEDAGGQPIAEITI